MSGKVVISGPASWNEIVLLEHLPEPRPHMQFALDDHETVGGTGAGKALGLAAFGREGRAAHAHRLGRRRRAASKASSSAVPNLELHAVDGSRTERHLNLMTPLGERVSIYLSTPDDRPSREDHRLTAAMEDAAAIGSTSRSRSRRMIPDARASGRPIWTDIHDYDGTAEFHSNT